MPEGHQWGRRAHAAEDTDGITTDPAAHPVVSAALLCQEQDQGEQPDRAAISTGADDQPRRGASITARTGAASAAMARNWPTGSSRCVGFGGFRDGLGVQHHAARAIGTISRKTDRQR